MPLTGWDVSSVTTMSSMCHEARSSDPPIGGWEVSRVENMETSWVLPQPEWAPVRVEGNRAPQWAWRAVIAQA